MINCGCSSGCSWASASHPQRASEIRSAACLLRALVTWGIALGLAELGVAEHLLDDADADALIEQQAHSG
jgi:hypothetical protein